MANPKEKGIYGISDRSATIATKMPTICKNGDVHRHVCRCSEDGKCKAREIYNFIKAVIHVACLPGLIHLITGQENQEFCQLTKM